ncbi:MAG: TetR/AcrR family transcriptional regulator [bacterium]
MPRPKIDVDQKRREILAVAQRQIEQYGPHKVTMQDISEACGMSQSNIYRFFSSKDALLASLADQWFDEIESKLADVVRSQGTPQDVLELFIRTQFRMKRDRYDENPALFISYLTLAAMNPEAIQKHVARLQKWLRALVRNCLPPGKPAQRMVALVEDMTIKYRDPHLISAHRKECTDVRLDALLRAVHELLSGELS